MSTQTVKINGRLVRVKGTPTKWRVQIGKRWHPCFNYEVPASGRVCANPNCCCKEHVEPVAKMVEVSQRPDGEPVFKKVTRMERTVAQSAGAYCQPTPESGYSLCPDCTIEKQFGERRWVDGEVHGIETIDTTEIDEDYRRMMYHGLLQGAK